MNITSIEINQAERRARRERLAVYLQERSLSGAVLWDSFYVLYFSGFAFVPTERPIAFVMSSSGETAMFVPRLEVEHARGKTGFERIDEYTEYPDRIHPMAVLKDALTSMRVTGAIGSDHDGYPWILGYRGPLLSETMGTRVEMITGFIEDLMMIKSQGELALIRESCTWGNLAHQLLQTYTRPGLTETEVAQRASNEATRAMLNAIGPIYQAQNPFARGAGAGYRGQIGRNASIPHALANNLTFRVGDVLVTGASAAMWGYNSELERTMVIGNPSDDQKRMFDHMMTAQQTAFDAMGPGKLCSAVDAAVRCYYESNDLTKYWKHHTGHAIGLRYHEGPFLDVGDDTVMRPGMVFTVEPGFYAAELGGFRHSDTVLITDDGIELLTYYPRDLDSLTLPA